jgi:flagellar motor switch protein FliG
MSDEILNRIAEQEQDLAEEVRRRLFLFEDFLGVGVDVLKEIMGRTDRKILMTALKGSREEVRTRFLQCMSQRGAEMFVEDIDALGPVKIKEVEGAQQQVVAVARQMEKTGAISLKSGGTDAYVV